MDEVMVLARKTLPFSIGGKDSEFSVRVFRKIIVENLVGYLSHMELKRDAKDWSCSEAGSSGDYFGASIALVPAHNKGEASCTLILRRPFGPVYARENNISTSTLEGEAVVQID